METRRLVLLIAMVSMGCRVGGPTGIAEGSAADAARAEGGLVDATGEGAPQRGPLDGAEGDEIGGDDASGASDSAGDETLMSCAAPFTSAVCDPVCNVGCPALSRCDVSDTPRTGACVGLWITQEGDLCFKGPTTDACAPQLTCVEGRCHRLCYRDADCTKAGTCCTLEIAIEAGGERSGFKGCAACAP